LAPGHADRRFSRQTEESVMARKKNKQAQKDKKAQKDKAQEARKPKKAESAVGLSGGS
jgi:hypothetical protein